MRARYYNPTLGRFISPDPLGIAGGLNVFAYAGDDPVNRSDPTGTFFFGFSGPSSNWQSAFAEANLDSSGGVSGGGGLAGAFDRTTSQEALTGIGTGPLQEGSDPGVGSYFAGFQGANNPINSSTGGSLISGGEVGGLSLIGALGGGGGGTPATAGTTGDDSRSSSGTTPVPTPNPEPTLPAAPPSLSPLNPPPFPIGPNPPLPKNFKYPIPPERNRIVPFFRFPAPPWLLETTE